MDSPSATNEGAARSRTMMDYLPSWPLSSRPEASASAEQPTNLASARSSTSSLDASQDESSPLLGSDKEGKFRKRVSHLRNFSFVAAQVVGERRWELNEDKQLQANKAYQLGKLATFRVFYAYTGTVLQNPTIWKETISVFGIYVLVVVLFYNLKWEGFKQFVGKEETIRAFLSIFSNLIGLLLSFYTSLNIGRWWAMRMHVQEIWSNASRLAVLLAHGVTTDEELLDAIGRYARCSLFLIFAVSQDLINPLEVMISRGILKPDEAASMAKLSDSNCFPLAAVPWAWLANAVASMHKQGLTMGPPHLCSLLDACESGRQGVTSIQTYLDTPIPMSYLHILGLMVKIHNVLVATLYGLVCVSLLDPLHINTNQLSITRTIFRAFCMPFLYNALLIMNVDLTNPFDGDMGDLTFSQLDGCMHAESIMMVKASKHRPEWMEGRKYPGWTP